jgi:DNA mismatch repair protein MutL
MERSKIQVLPPEVIDQIAAGEVVERPASVVKELVENALDAGASQVVVEIEKGGKERIRVVDDGIGMSPAQAELALVRHATSKLRSIDEIFGISTLGFRGEALASIASVSKLALVTRPRDDSAAGGTRLDVDGGLVVDKGPAGSPVGTSIEVCSLLHNVPARQKFLKGDATETAHITDAMSKIALAHPDVHFRLKHGARVTLNAPPHASRLERVRAILGSKAGRGLVEVYGEEHGVKVSAFLAPPESAQSTSRGLQLFVGRRPVKDRGLLHAVVMGYGELVPKGRYPVAVVFVDIVGSDVDVNVHPQKLEVRFAAPQRVYAAVRHTVARGAAEADWLQHEQAHGPAPVALRPWTPSAAPMRASELAERYARDTTRSLLPFGRRPSREPAAPPSPPTEVRAEGSNRTRSAAIPDRPPEAPPMASEKQPVSGFFEGLRYIGQLDRTYLVCERDSEMVLIDQHAAHERVAFARLKERFKERQMPVQRMLFPLTIELAEPEAAVASESKDELAGLGFELEPFGGTSWAIKSAPADLRESEVAKVVKQLLEDLSTRGGSRAVEERLDNVLATIACHSVVRAGDVLGVREAEALLESMSEIEFGGYCPHGRPVLLRMRMDEIARRFGRS